MSEIQNNKEIIAKDHGINAHEFLVAFLDKFHAAQRGGIHDFIEIAIYNMINSAIKDIDTYLSTGQKSVSANEIMTIFADSCQTVLDNIKRNLEKLGEVNLQ